MNVKKYKVLRDIPINDPKNYDEIIIEKDTIVYECIYHTYGCISHTGIAVTRNENGGYPFFEIHNEDVELIAL